MLLLLLLLLRRVVVIHRHWQFGLGLIGGIIAHPRLVRRGLLPTCGGSGVVRLLPKDEEATKSNQHEDRETTDDTADDGAGVFVLVHDRGAWAWA